MAYEGFSFSKGPQPGGASATFHGSEPVTTPAQQPVNPNAQEIARLESELAQAEAELAEFDRANPGIASGDAMLAANRAEGGDMSLYTGMTNAAENRALRESAEKESAITAINNAIANAKEMAARLEDQNDEFIEERKIKVENDLESARRTAAKYGLQLPSDWYVLNDRLEKVKRGEVNPDNLQNWEYRIWQKMNSKTLTDSDIKEMEEFVAKNPNSELAKYLMGRIPELKKNTTEAGARRDAERAKADSIARGYKFTTMAEIQNFANRWNSGTDAEIKLLKKYYTFDPSKGLKGK